MSVIIIQWCNSGIKLHSKQKYFDDSCIAVCIGKQAADLSRFKFCFKSNCKKIPMKSQIEELFFESNLYSSNWFSKGAQIAS